jgi:hypothetical protein
MPGYWDLQQQYGPELQRGVQMGASLADMFIAARDKRKQESQLAEAQKAADQEAMRQADAASRERQFQAGIMSGDPIRSESAAKAYREQNPIGLLQFEKALQGEPGKAPDLGDIPEFQKLYPNLAPGSPEFAARYNRWKLERQRPPMQITLGDKALGLTGGQQSAVQGELRGAATKLSMIDDVEQAIKDAGGHEVVSDLLRRKALQFGGTASNVIPGVLSAENQQKLAQVARVEASLATLNNKVINELSGAAVSESEMERIAKSLPLIEDPAPVRLTKINAWKRNLGIIEKQGVDALMNGLRDQWSGAPTKAPIDMSQYSDEELARIAGGG